MKSKSRGLFPGPSSRPKRSFSSSAGNSEYKHSLPNSDGMEGFLGWKAGRSAGGESGNARLAGRPFKQADIPGDGGFAYDSSCAPYLGDKGKPQP